MKGTKGDKNRPEGRIDDAAAGLRICLWRSTKKAWAAYVFGAAASSGDDTGPRPAGFSTTYQATPRRAPCQGSIRTHKHAPNWALGARGRWTTRRRAERLRVGFTA